MSAPISQPVYTGSTAHGAAYKPVVVIAVDTGKRYALCRDQYGKTTPVRCDIMRAKGVLPAVGENWIIDRQYGDWVFGAILNGGTSGVAASDVTGLDDAMAAVAGNPAYNVNAQENGRWVGTTVLGPPDGDSYNIGDWVNDQEGYVWTFTANGWVTRGGDSDSFTDLKNRVALLNNRATAQETYGNHQYRQTSGTWGTGDAVIRGLGTFTDGGIAELRAGAVYLNRMGKWFIAGAAKTVAKVAGSQTTYLYWPGGPMEYWPEDTRPRDAGTYNGAGILRQRVTWEGWVSAAQARQALRLKIGWYPSDGQTGLNYAENDFYLECNYLGGA